MANNWDFDVECGQHNFLLRVTRTAGVIFSDMRVLLLPTGEYQAVLDYVSDNTQTDPGPDRFDSGVKITLPTSFYGVVAVDGQTVVSDIRTKNTCP